MDGSGIQIDDEEASTSSWESTDSDESYIAYERLPVETFRRIERNDDSLRSLNIEPYHPNRIPPPENWVALGRNLGRNSHMKNLTITTGCIDWEADGIASKENMEAFCSGLSQNRSLEFLQFDHFNFQQVRLETLHPFVMQNNCLVDLQLHSSGLCTRDIERLSSAFSQRNNPSSIKSIGIGGETINDDSVEAIVELCSWCPRLRKLDLDFSKIGSQGCNALDLLLQHQNPKLRCLSIKHNKLGNEGALVLATALINNKSLKRLGLRECNIDDLGWNSFMRILCDTTSINATNQSNHHLEKLWSESNHYGLEDMRLPQSILLLLDTNTDRNKTAVARKKIFHSHLNGDFNLAPFLSMGLELLPNVLCFISKDYYTSYGNVRQNRSSAFYRIVRSFPGLCDFPSSERKLRRQLEVEVAVLKADNNSLRQQVEKLTSVIEELQMNKRAKS